MTFKWTQLAVEMLTTRTKAGESAASIAAQLGCIDRTVRQKQADLGLVPMRTTYRFKKGERTGAARRNWRPIGTILSDHDGYQRIKVREGTPEDRAFGFGNVSIWPLLQRHVWEKHKGPIPPNHTIVFRDGNRANCDIDNLECISRRDLMLRNSIHARYPKELKDTIMLLGAVKRRVREQCQKTA